MTNAATEDTMLNAATEVRCRGLNVQATAAQLSEQWDAGLPEEKHGAHCDGCLESVRREYWNMLESTLEMADELVALREERAALLRQVAEWQRKADQRLQGIIDKESQ